MKFKCKLLSKDCLKKLIIFLFVFIIFTSVILSFLWNNAISPVCATSCTNSEFLITKGESLSEISRNLRNTGLIKNSTVFKILSYVSGMNGKIQAGNYNLNFGMSATEILNEFKHGTADLRFTIVEGLRREEIAEKIGKIGFSNFSINEFIKNTVDLEGKLFPDTYFLPLEANTQTIIDTMSKNFSKKVGVINKDILIMASLIEREVPHDIDRPIIAGILTKRLVSGWPLQIDATVQYAVTNVRCKQNRKCESWWPKSLTKEDLKTISPFNSYLNLGLPPSPICSPGLSAIEAAKKPEISKYWYYISDNQGVIHYAETLEEHNTNVRKYLLSL